MQREAIGVLHHPRGQNAVDKATLDTQVCYGAGEDERLGIVFADDGCRVTDQRDVVIAQARISRAVQVPLVPDFIKLHRIAQLASEVIHVVQVRDLDLRLARLCAALI